jgi:hypothetical protein
MQVGEQSSKLVALGVVGFRQSTVGEMRRVIACSDDQSIKGEKKLALAASKERHHARN